jgi:transposase-like protein
LNEKNQKRLEAIKNEQLLNHKSMRPDYDELVRFVQENGYSATGRKYGVSDNAIRKWIKAYQKDLRVTETIRFNKDAWYQEHGRVNKVELQALADQGLSLKEIARHYRVHRNTAKKWCQQHQVQTPGMQTASQGMN